MPLTRRQLLSAAGAGAGAVALGLPQAAGAVQRVSPLAVGPDGAADVLRLARVWPGTTPRLLDAFDDTHVVFDDGSIEVLLWPGDLARLEATGMRFEITVADLVSRDRALEASAGGRPVDLAPQPGERTGYRRLEDVNADLRELAARFPGQARLVELPHKSLEGRTVLAIEIAEDVAASDGRPTFYMDGIHHAREWPACEFTIMWAFDLLESYAAGDTQVVSLMKKLRFFVVPVMNVDGFHYSRSSLVDNSATQGGNGAFAYWRKNRRTVTNTYAVQTPVGDLNSPDAYGIDNNRNYGYAWGGDGSSSSQVSQTYRGPAPFSEPETKNVQWALSTRHATAMITNHTSGNLILWAWGDTRDDAPDNELLVSLGRAMAQFNGYRPQKSIDLYVTTGTCSDYAYGSFGSIGYTFEHAGSSFHPNYAATIPRQYAQNRPAFLLLAEAAADPQHHGVVTGRLVDASGAPVVGSVQVDKVFETLLWKDGNGSNPTGKRSVTESLTTTAGTDQDGRFVVHVNPSTRPFLSFRGESEAYVLTLAAGGATAQREVVVGRGQVRDLGDVVVG